jgi:hypothetical protein
MATDPRSLPEMLADAIDRMIPLAAAIDDYKIPTFDDETAGHLRAVQVALVDDAVDLDAQARIDDELRAYLAGRSWGVRTQVERYWLYWITVAESFLVAFGNEL